MKKIVAILTVLILLFSLAACKSQVMDGDGMIDELPPCTLNVFAAASMTETLTELQKIWNTLYEPNIELVFTFDSSGTLKTQIEEGAVCDVFISAAQKQMNQLDELGLIDAASRVDLLENKCALVVPEGNPAGITSYEDLGTDKVTKIALGNSDVPVGQYSEEILTYMGLWDELNAAQKITFGDNVKTVTKTVSEMGADCGIVYGTDAAAAGLEVVAYPPEGSHSPIVYPAAILANTEYPEQANRFMVFLQTIDAANVFEAAGFTVAE